jgi:cytochrome d ubiquinol oxidase subunit II
MMDLNTVWFMLIAILYIGFFVLEGFDFGVGMLLPIVGKNDTERRVVINAIGPHWDGNEVWLLTAGGATFAAFPMWYATLFSGFYLPLFFLLAALILRGVAFEYRSKDENPKWRKFWDWTIFASSLVSPLLLGVAFANLVRGVPVDAEMNYVGGFFNLLNPYALLGGVAAVLLFILHGAIFLSKKTTEAVEQRAKTISRRIWLPVVVVMLALLLATYFATDLLFVLGVNPGLIPLAGVAAMLSVGYFARANRFGWAFIMTSVTIAFSLVTMFQILYPRVMISSLNPQWSLTIYNSSSTPYTLTVMTVIAVVFVPIVLIYQGWSYWVFRKRIENKPETLTY